jgi:hypothetical protein
MMSGKRFCCCESREKYWMGTTNCDTPPNSLKDSNASLKVKTTKEKGVGIHSLVHITLG